MEVRHVRELGEVIQPQGPVEPFLDDDLSIPRFSNVVPRVVDLPALAIDQLLMAVRECEFAVFGVLFVVERIV